MGKAWSYPVRACAVDPGEQRGVQPGGVALHVAEEVVENGRVADLPVVRPEMHTTATS